MHCETSRRLVDISGEYITGVTVTGQVCCLHQTQKPGRHLSPAISCQHHQPWRHLGPARSCTEHRAKIHSGNLTLHRGRADRDTDISTGLLLLELQVGQCSKAVRVDPRHENIRDGRNVIDPSLGRIKAHDCLMVINYKPRPGYSNNFPRIRLQFRQKMNNSMT